jgi:hypothetical protein
VVDVNQKMMGWEIRETWADVAGATIERAKQLCRRF